MKYMTLDFTDLLDSPTGKPIVPLDGGLILTGTGNKSEGAVEVHADDKTGWLAKGTFEVAERDELNVVAFVRECIIIERLFNDLVQTKLWFVLADYLLARAIIETQPEIENAGPKFDGSDATGPLQVSPEEWKKFLDSDNPLKTGFIPDDFDDYIMQVRGAAYTMHADAKAISQIKRAAGLGSDQDPPLPSYLEIYLAYVTGSPTAAVALVSGTASAADMGQDVAANSPLPPGTDGGKKLNAFLKKAAEGGKGDMSDDQIATLFKRRAAWTGSNDANAKTIGEFVTAVSDELNKALGEAFDLIKKHAPETVVPPGGGPAPWFTVAKKEATTLKNLDEIAPVADARIKEYFHSIEMAAGGKTPWCAAFVSFCVKTSGNPAVAATVPKHGPALAATWQFWGEPLPVNAPTLPPGAVVVLIPTEKSDTSGHVGFCVRSDEKTVTLLGGNQSNRLKESTYSRSRIVAVRWLDVGIADQSPKQASQVKPDPIPVGRESIAKMILEKFAAAGYGRIQQIAALANAIKESSLDPKARRTRLPKEDSVGLFQLNMQGGAGSGHTVATLEVAEKNIELIIEVARRVPSFGRAATLEAAVRAFVTYVEIPADKEGAIAERLAVANALA